MENFISISSIIGFFLDRQTLKRVLKEPMSNRRNISEQFSQFKTGWGRLKYVRYLQSLNIKPEGTWPDGKIPSYMGFDEASTLLAQLEEKWLGLDR